MEEQPTGERQPSGRRILHSEVGPKNCREAVAASHSFLEFFMMEGIEKLCARCADGCASCVICYCDMCGSRPSQPDLRAVIFCPLGLCCCFIVPLTVGVVLLVALGGSHSNMVAGYVLLALPGTWVLLWLLFICIFRPCAWHYRTTHAPLSDEANRSDVGHERRVSLSNEEDMPGVRTVLAPYVHNPERVLCVGRPGCTNFGSDGRGGMCSVCFSDYGRDAERHVPCLPPATSESNGDYVIMPTK